MINTKNIILLSAIVLGGVVFFFIGAHTCKVKTTMIREKAKEAFVKAVEEKMGKIELDGEITSTLETKSVLVDRMLPDSVFLITKSGRHRYRLDPQKDGKNITNSTELRCLHSFAFEEKMFLVDSLNIRWKELLLEAGITADAVLHICVIDQYEKIKLENSIENKWCNLSHLVFTLYMGYACEIEVEGYLHYSVWQHIYKNVVFYLLLYALYILIVYQICRVYVVRSKKIGRILSPEEVLEVSSIPSIQTVNSTPIRSYKLREDIIFLAEKKMIKVGETEKELHAQLRDLLELFFQQSEYILKDETLLKTLWPDGSGTSTRLLKAVGRLRSFLHQIDPSIDIKRGRGTYQLIL